MSPHCPVPEQRALLGQIAALLLVSAAVVSPAGAMQQPCAPAATVTTEQASPDALALADIVMASDRILPLVVRKTGETLGQSFDQNDDMTALEARYPGLRNVAVLAAQELAQRCFPDQIEALQTGWAAVIDRHATPAQMRQIGAFSASPAGRRFAEAGIRMGMAATSDVPLATAAQREAVMLEESRRIIASLSPAELSALSRFSSSAAGQAFLAAQPEVQTLFSRWIEGVTIAVRPMVEASIGQAVAEHIAESHSAEATSDRPTPQ